LLRAEPHRFGQKFLAVWEQMEQGVPPHGSDGTYALSRVTLPSGCRAPDLEQDDLGRLDPDFAIGESMEELSTPRVKDVKRIEGRNPAVRVHGWHALAGLQPISAFFQDFPS
jgi:hypothetical protein